MGLPVWLWPALFVFVAVVSSHSILDSAGKCYDITTNKTYGIGEMWTVASMVCGKFRCEKQMLKEVENISFPVPVKLVCADPKAPDNDLRNCHKILPKPHAEYPLCCPHMVCFRDDHHILIYPVLANNSNLNYKSKMNNNPARKGPRRPNRQPLW